MNILTSFKNLLIESLKDNKKLILILYTIFIVTFIIAWIVSGIEFASMFDTLENSSESNMNVTLTATELFIHNALGGVVTYLGSIFFGIWAIISIIYNAVNLGMIGALFNTMLPDGGLHYIVYLIPHGIFEITGTVLQSVAGILLFKFIWKFVKNIIRSDEIGFKQKLSKSFENNKKILIQSFVLLIFSIILMLIAAPIEAYISIPISDLIFGPIQQ